jgi:hypothetical protein
MLAGLLRERAASLAGQARPCLDYAMLVTSQTAIHLALVRTLVARATMAEPAHPA